jgi:hypothetical protein
MRVIRFTNADRETSINPTADRQQRQPLAGNRVGAEGLEPPTSAM